MHTYADGRAGSSTLTLLVLFAAAGATAWTYIGSAHWQLAAFSHRTLETSRIENDLRNFANRVMPLVKNSACGAPGDWRELRFLPSAGTPIPPPLEGDVNDDNRVDSADLGIVLATWGQVPGYVPGQPSIRSDFNRDGLVNSVDLTVILSHWGDRRDPPADDENSVPVVGPAGVRAWCPLPANGGAQDKVAKFSRFPPS
ncbi:MAG: dockerin type I domain-containing protein, partial [Bacteriovoracia bacterium]